MDSIFIVVGQTGEYSDRIDWFVAAFPTRAEAEEYEDKLTKWTTKHGINRNQNDAYSKHDLKCPLDPSMQCEYTGVDYYVAEVPWGAPQSTKTGED